MNAERPPPSALDRALLAIGRLESKLKDMEAARNEPVAVVGLACRFPAGGNTPERYWEALLEGRDGVVPIPEERWSTGATVEAGQEAPGVRLAGLIDGVDGFDHEFFGISPREARSIDPQHRLLLEVAWEALERAGLPAERLEGSRTGVFIGATTQDYQTELVRTGLERLDAYTAIGNGLCFAAGRLAYVLGLQGPALTLDTACSSSLVATHLALSSLRAGECDIALAGGVNLILSPIMMSMMSRTHALSPDGRCRTFDARANGIARGEGCGVVILKRLSDALRDRDEVWAVLRASAVNQDGRSAGLTTPNGAAQQALLRQALLSGRIDASRVGFVEAHGTGTALGDPIEVEAIRAVYGKARDDGSTCFLGAVKTNLGHLEAAAGIAGVIKAVLCVRHGLVPRNLHFEKLNPRIELDGSALAVPTRSQPWGQAGALRLAGVSSFGLSGTNAHVLVEQAPSRGAMSTSAPSRPLIFALSARSPAALDEATRRWLALAEDPAPLGDLSWTSLARRSQLSHRLTLAARSPAELRDALGLAAAGGLPRWSSRGEALHRPRLIYVFPGQGSWWKGMGRGLYASEPAFRAEMQALDELVRAEAGWSVLEALHAEPGQMEELDRVQPLLFCVSVALSTLLASLGLRPDAVVGHSMGEVAAAAVAGALGRRDAVAVICRRSRLLLRAAPMGSMAVVELPAEAAAEAIAELGGDVVVAGRNSPRTTVLAGGAAALERLALRFEAEGVFFRVVRGSPPSHGPMVSSLGPLIARELATVKAEAARVPMMSTARLGWLRGPELDADYWVDNLLSPVCFAEAVELLSQEGPAVFLEVSANPVLTAPMEQCLNGREAVVLGALRKEADESMALASVLAGLHTAGISLPPESLPARGQLVSLPGYAWQRSRHWVDAPAIVHRVQDPEAHPLVGRPVEQADRPGHSLWSAWLGQQQLPWVQDHRVGETALFPATGYVSMAMAIGRARWGGVGLRLEGLSLELALPLPAEGGVQSQVTVHEAEPGLLEMQFWSADPVREGTWRRHASGRLRRDGLAGEGSWSAPPDLHEHIDAAAHYRGLADMGLAYGPRFRAVRHLRRRAGEAVAEVRPDEAVLAETARLGLHPALLDALLQVLASAFCGSFALPRGSTWLPVRIGALRILGPVDQGGMAHAKVKAGPESGHPGGDVCLYSADGQLLVQATDLQMAPLAGAVGVELRYERRWQPAPALADAPSGASTWLLVGEGEAAEGLHRRWGGGGALLGCLRPGEAGLRAQLRQLAPDAVVYCMDCPAPSLTDGPEQVLSELQRVSGGLLRLVQELLDLPCIPRLWIVTRGALGLEQDPGPVSMVGASLWGFAASLDHEHPALRVRRVDLDPLDLEGSIDRLCTLLHREGAEDQWAIRARGDFVARAHRGLAPADGLPPLRSGVSPSRPVRLCRGRPGMLEELRLVASPRTPPAPGEVELCVEVAGLNFRDVLEALGAIPSAVEDPPLGCECAGVVSAVGAGVEGLRVGDRVLALAVGALASFVCVPAPLVHPLPEGMSMEQAATLPVVFTTAYAALARAARLSRGERVLIHAATGGVGLAAIQWVRHIGAEVLATAGNSEKRALLERMGILRVSDSRSDRFVEDVLAWTEGRGADVVLNCLGGELLRRSYDALADFGRFAEIGAKEYDKNAASRNQAVSIVDLRSYILDRPELGGELLGEVLRHFQRGIFSPLPVTSFPVGRVAEAMRWMADARHVGKIAISMVDPEAQVHRSHLGPPLAELRGTWVVTGGLSGLGLETAGWLLGAGQRSVALLGRRPPAPEVEKRLQSWRQEGASLRCWSVDVSDRGALAQALHDVRTSMGPICGVVHSAMVLHDRAVTGLSWSAFAEVLAPKALGAWNLHALTAEDPIQHFVLYSSGAALMGSPGQANYCAANAFVDALAQHRRANGFPAVSIQWGALAEVGQVAAREGGAARMGSQGLGSLSLQEASRAFRSLLQSAPPVVAVLDLDVERWRAAWPQAARAPLLSGLGGRVEERSGGWSQQLLHLDRDEARAQVQALVQRLLATVLRLEPGRIQPDSAFGGLGLDSLMAIELRNRLEAETGLQLSATLVWNFPSVARLTAHLLDRLCPPPVEVAPPLPAAPPPEPSLAEVSEQELLDMFDDSLSALEELV